jgi:putative transcriptional regulator
VDTAAEQLLTHHAAGRLDVAGSLLAAAYREINPAAAATGGLYDKVSSSFLDNAPEMPLSAGAVDRLMQRLDTASDVPLANETALPHEHPSPYPRSIHPYLPRQRDGSLRWRSLGALRVCTLFKQNDGSTFSLVAAAPGKPLPQHTHRGEEFALVLSGTLQDERGNFTRGDLVYADAHIDHKPMAIGEHECVCLVLTRDKLKFTGRYGGVLNFLQGSR